MNLITEHIRIFEPGDNIQRLLKENKNTHFIMHYSDGLSQTRVSEMSIYQFSDLGDFYIG